MTNPDFNLYSSSEDRIQTPSISLRTVGGSVFPVIDEGQVISIQVRWAPYTCIYVSLYTLYVTILVLFEICSNMSMFIAWRLSRVQNSI